MLIGQDEKAFQSYFFKHNFFLSFFMRPARICFQREKILGEKRSAKKKAPKGKSFGACFSYESIPTR